MNIVYATTSALLAHDGRRIRIEPGEVWAAHDPLVARYPDMFSPTPSGARVTTTAEGWAPYDAAVEQATRAPGEKRPTRRPPRNG